MAVQSFQLDNGLQVLLAENHAAPVVALNALAKVGSAFETDPEAGISHVIEHMLFKGTPTRPVGSIARDVEAAGGEINAYTSFDQTVYYINMASRYVDQGLAILSDAVSHPLFDAEELKREQEVILEEIRREHDNPSRMASEYLFQTAYEHHSYRRPIIGYVETVRSFTHDTLLNFYRRWYVPANMAFIVVGNFETKTMLEKVRRAFEGFTGSPPPSHPSPAEHPQQRQKLFVTGMNIQSTHGTLGYHIPAVVHPDVPAIDVLSHILGGAESSRLELEVKEKKRLVHRIGSYSYTPRDPGLFAVQGMFNDGNAAKALAAIREEIERIQQHAVSQAELELAKTNIRAMQVYERETVGGESDKLSNFLATAGSHEFEARYYQMLMDVRTDDVRRVAQTYLQEKNLTAVLVTPKKSPWSSKKAQLTNALRPPSSRTHRRSDRSELEPSITHFPNGLTLIVRENHTLPIVSVVATVLGGNRCETPKTSGINALTARALTKGTKRRSAKEIAQTIDSFAGNLDGFTGRNAIGLRSEFLSDHVREGFSLFTEVLTEPSFDPNEVKNERALQMQAIRDQEDSLSTVAFLHFFKTLYPHHPYGMPSLGTKTTVASFTSNHLQRSWSDTVRCRNLVLSIAGDVSSSEAEDVAKRLMDKLPQGKPRTPKITHDKCPRSILRIETTKKEKEQAHIVLGFQGPRYKSPDHYAITVLNNILAGQGGRLFLELRDKQSLAYSVSSSVQAGIDPGHFAVYMGTEPGKVDTAIEGILRELTKIREREVKTEELKRAQEYLVGTYELDLQRNGSWASNLAFNELYGLGIDEVKRYPQKILAVTRDDILRAAHTYIHPDAYVLSIVRPK
ncbi:MAG: insulinase family protein [Deltaproteobacteria bacterium]|nr:insulinase family protein [Deltaproteobacteria bacterium]